MKDEKSCRDGFGEALLELGKNKKIVALSADLAPSVRMKWFKEKKYHITNREITINTSSMPVLVSNQALEWISCIMPFIDTNSNVHFGYIFPDSFWHKRQEFVKAFYALNSIKCVSNNTTDLFFDLEWTHKDEIVNKLKKLKLLKLISTCEDPVNYKPCKKCEKCLELKNTLEKIKGEKK